MSFTNLDENHKGKSVFMYGGVMGEITRDGNDTHIRIAFGASEMNFVCEDADEFLNVAAELLMQDSRWATQILEEGEPF